MIHEDFIEQNYKGYTEYLESQKRINSPFVVSDKKENHKASYYSTTKLNGTYMFGDTNLSCEVKNSNAADFSIAIISSLIPSRVLFRYDSDGLPHKNSADYIPLPEQSVPTPHYHQFDDKGNLLAYQSEDMKDSKKIEEWRKLENVFNEICKMNNIRSHQSDEMPLIALITGDITYDLGDDPINGLVF